MTRVLVIEAAGNLWGSERALLDLVRDAPDLDVAVCCPPGTPLVPELRALGIRTLPWLIGDLHRKSRWQRARAALGVLRACLTHRPDVIHVNQSGSYRVALGPAKLLRIPVVAHVRIFEDAAYLARQHAVGRRLAALVAISDAVEIELRRFPSLASIPLRRVYDAYRAVSTAPSTAASTTRRVACIGRLVPIKGQDILLGALAVLHRQGRDIACVIAGEGDPDFTRRLHESVSSLGLERTVQWAGFAREVVPLLRECAVLACPSHREPLGRVIFEAWDAGIVPVAFAGSGGAAEVIAAAKGGVLYAEQTAEALAAALDEAMTLAPDARGRLVANGRAWMAEHCGTEAYGRAISGILAAAATKYALGSTETP